MWLWCLFSTPPVAPNLHAGQSDLPINRIARLLRCLNPDVAVRCNKKVNFFSVCPVWWNGWSMEKRHPSGMVSSVHMEEGSQWVLIQPAGWGLVPAGQQKGHSKSWRSTTTRSVNNMKRPQHGSLCTDASWEVGSPIREQGRGSPILKVACL